VTSPSDNYQSVAPIMRAVVCLTVDGCEQIISWASWYESECQGLSRYEATAPIVAQIEAAIRGSRHMIPGAWRDRIIGKAWVVNRSPQESPDPAVRVLRIDVDDEFTADEAESLARMIYTMSVEMRIP
jgi:hypothetical protein